MHVYSCIYTERTDYNRGLQNTVIRSERIFWIGGQLAAVLV